MAAYTLVRNTNIDELGDTGGSGYTTVRAGGDTIANTNGYSLTIDEDIRFGRWSPGYATNWASNADVGSLGSMTQTASRGGNILIDGRYVRLIPFDSGSGNVPEYGTTRNGLTITKGGASGKLCGVYSSLTSMPLAGGQAMPASGWIKIKGWNGTAYSAGALSGISANATGVDVAGWITLNGDDAGTFSGNRLGKFEVKGAWYEIGTTTGIRSTTYNVPNNGKQLWVPAIFVQGATWTVTAASWADGITTYTAAGHDMLVGQRVTITGASPSGYNVDDVYITDIDPAAGTFSVAVVSDPGTWSSGGSAIAYEVWPCAGTLPALVANIKDENTRRGKAFWNTNATTSLALPLGYIRFGHDGTNSTGGYCPPAGRKIRIGNVFLTNNTTAIRYQNSIPHATHATRYDFTMTGAGQVYFDKCSMCWYPSMTQAQAIQVTDSGIMSAILTHECPTPILLRNMAVGQEAASVGVASWLANYNPAGILAEHCVFTLAATSGTTQHNPALLTYSKDVVATDCVGWLYGARTGGSKQTNFTVCENLLLTRWHNVNSKLYVTTSKGTTVKDIKHTDTTGARLVTQAMGCINLTGLMPDSVVEGLSYVGDRAQNFLELVSCAAAIGPNISVRNIGTPTNPLLTGEGPFYNKGWTRATTTCTVTHTAHGFLVGEYIHVFHVSSTSAISVAVKAITAVPTADTFQFACTNGGDASGTISYCWVPVSSAVLCPTSTSGVKVQRIYPKFLRNYILSGDNTSSNCHVENSFPTFNPDLVSGYGNINLLMLNMTGKLGGLPGGGANPSVYGSDWQDGRCMDFPDVDTCDWTRSGGIVTATLTGGGSNYMNQCSSYTPVIQVLTSSDENALNIGQNALVTIATGGSNANSLTLSGYNTGATSGTCTIATETGRVQINFNEASTTVQNYILGGSNSAGSGFNGSGGLVLPVVGDTVTYECPYWIRGHTGFMMAPPAMTGGTIANYHIEYQIDTGAGWSGWKNAFRQTITAVADYTAGQYTITGVAAADMTWVQEGDHIQRAIPNYDIRRNAKIAVGGISGTTITLDKTHNSTSADRAFYAFHLPEETIDYQTGFKLKVRITTIIANTTGMTSLYFRTFQTPTSRQVQLPLDTFPVSVTVKNSETLAAIPDAHVYIYRVSDKALILSGATDAAGLVEGTTEYAAGTAIGGWVRQMDLSGADYEQRNISGTITSNGFDTTVLLTPI